MATALSLLRFAPLLPRLTRSSLTINLTSSPKQSVRIRPRVAPISTSYTVPTIDRVVFVLSYTIPFFETLTFGCLLEPRYPFIASLTSPFLPVLLPYERTARFDFLAFFIRYVSLAQNPNMSRYVRFNAMQAMMLDVMLALPMLVVSIVETSPTRIASKVVEFGYWVIFVLGFVTSVYSVLCCLVGRTPYFPFLSSAADKQL